MQYYYFITGLPSISIEDSKQVYELQAFREDAKKHLTEKDYHLLKLLDLPDELELLLAHLYERPIPERADTVFPEDWWPEYISLIKDKISNPMFSLPNAFKDLPSFIGEFVEELLQMEELPDYFETDTKLLNLAYEYLESIPNKFIKAWFALERDLRNILIAINGREHDYDYASFLIGKSEVADKLARSSSTDFGLGKSSELFDAIWRIYEQNNILFREKGYDLLRWKWIESSNFFQYFTIDRILGYYCKLRIVNRWVSMDTDSGKDSFYDSLSGLEQTFEIPHEFTVRAIQGGSPTSETESQSDKIVKEK